MNDANENSAWITLSMNVDMHKFFHQYDVPVADVPALEKIIDDFLDEVRGVVAKTEQHLESIYPKRN